LYCIAAFRGERVAHLWYDTIEAAARAIEAIDAKGDTVYHACASFHDKSRKSTAAAYARSFWLDLDVGDGPNKFPTLSSAASLLKKFLTDANLPNPSMLISSGGGIHVYWVADADIPIDVWRPIAADLKRLTLQHKFFADPSRTADAASILRPVGSHNRKYAPSPVVAPIMTNGKVLSVETFTAAIRSTLVAAPIKPRAGTPDINADFGIKRDFPPADAERIAAGCRQMRAMRDTRGNLPEPVWYAGLQVLAHCADGARVAHAWSQGHPSYSASETDAKFEQVKGFGPTLCATFESRNPDGCKRCPSYGKVASPVLLGAPLPGIPQNPPEEGFSGTQEADIPLEGALVPEGFLRSPTGPIFYVRKPKDGEAPPPPVLVSSFDIYANELAHDDQAHCEMMLIRANSPATGATEFALPTTVLAADKDLEVALRKHHAKPANIKAMRQYLSMQVDLIEKHRQPRRYYVTMGWKDQGRQFVWGNRVFHADGTTELVTIADGLKATAEAMTPTGDLQAWIDLTDAFNVPEFVAHAFMFAACAGAPLMRFTGHAGALINAVGNTNSGKSSMARFGLSIFGDYERIKLKQRDTENAKVARIAQLGSLPAYIDEITNEDPGKLSDFVYEISQGRSKLRLDRAGVEKPTYEWNTLALSSSNTAMSQRLMLSKANPEAERMRLLEFPLQTVGAFTPALGERVFRTCSCNYALAAEKYLAYIVTHQVLITDELKKVHDELRRRTESRGVERMWSAAAASAIYALVVLKRLKLSNIEVGPVLDFVVRSIKDERSSVDQDRFDPLDNLGTYLNQFAFGRLTIHEEIQPNGKVKRFSVERMPTRELVMRFDTSKRKLWIDARHYRAWLAERHESWAGQLPFMRSNRLYGGERKINLGAGTPMTSAMTQCYEFDMAAPAFGETLMAVVTSDGGFDQRTHANTIEARGPL
jgi:hypothetical protein